MVGERHPAADASGGFSILPADVIAGWRTEQHTGPDSGVSRRTRHRFQCCGMEM